MCIRDRYEGFKQTFRIKYWSESVQTIIRDNLCRGRYNATHYQSPTAYFLGKVCVARNLESKIPEECLISKMAHRFDEGIVQATLCSQIKTVADMERLLGSYEHQDYYRKSRRQYD